MELTKEIEQLKKEIREEVREEMLNLLEKNKKSNVWQRFTKDSIKPLLEEKGLVAKEKYNFINALNTIARVYTKKDQVCKINEEELEKVKPIVLWLVNSLEAENEKSN